MGSVLTAPQHHTKAVSGIGNVAVDFSGELEPAEMLTGTPVVEEVNADDLSFANIGVNTIALTINNRAVPIGKAVQFKVSGGVAGTQYTIRLRVSTNANPAQALVGRVILDVEAD